MAAPPASPGPRGRFEQEQERAVRALVRCVTSLPEEELGGERFQAALNFAWSNFRFHRFLDVNSHKVERTIEGIHEKLVIHSDLGKAESWKRLTEKFLNLPLPSTEETKTDTHYSILSLLLCLSDSPSNTTYVEKPRVKEVDSFLNDLCTFPRRCFECTFSPFQECEYEEVISNNTNYKKEEEFDWGKYLMEGEEIYFGPGIDTPDWSGESEEEEDTQPLSREDSGIQVDRTPLEDQDPNKKTVPHASWKVGEPDARSWLEQHVVPQYWTGRAPRFSHSLHLHSNLAAVWDHHLYTSDPLYVPEERTLVTETQVIRETLWLLSGVKKLFIFQLNDGKVTVRNDIIVTHLTHNCLRSVLEQIAAYGQVVFRLQKFIDEVMGHSPESIMHGTVSTPKKTTEAPFRTYQAFMWALYKYFISFKEELTEIEKCIINKDKTVTLSIVIDKLSPRLTQLKVLHKVFSTGVAEVPPDTRNVVRASHLLNTLYKAILEYDSVGEASEQTVSLLFSLWVETVRPYLQTVDEWIVHGNLFDPAKEFIIQRNKNVPVNHRDFWYATYTLYSVSEKTENEEKMSDNASASSGSDQAPSSRQHTMVSFLKPVLKQIIMAGNDQLQKQLVFSRVRGHVPGSEDVPIAETSRDLALMMNGSSMGLSVPVLKHEDYLLRTSPVSKNSRKPGSSHGSSSGKKMVGFGVSMDDGQSPQMQTKREGTKSRKGTASGLRKDAAMSPGLMGSSRVPATTAVSPIQHDPSRYQVSLLDLVEAMNPISAPGQLCREPCDRNKPHTPCCASHRLSSSWCQTPCSPRSRADELEESRLLEEIFFI